MAWAAAAASVCVCARARERFSLGRGRSAGKRRRQGTELGWGEDEMGCGHEFWDESGGRGKGACVRAQNWGGTRDGYEMGCGHEFWDESDGRGKGGEGVHVCVGRTMGTSGDVCVLGRGGGS